MDFYKIIIKKESGKKETFDIEAESFRKAEYEALRMGQIISIKKKRGLKFLSYFKQGMTPYERNTFLYTLATLTSALPINEALFIMQQNFKGSIKSVCARFSRLLATNEPHQAIEKIGAPDFPGIVVSMINSGVSAGNLSDAFREAADFEKDIIDIKKESGKGMYQAIGAFILSAIVIFVIMLYVVPWMNDSVMMKAMKVDTNWLDPYLNFSFYSMLTFSIIFVLLYLLGTIGRVISPIIADNIILSIPIYKDLVLSKLNFITIYQLSRLIEKGIPLKVALERTKENTNKGKLKNEIELAIKNLESGKEWSDAMLLFSPMDRAGLRASTDYSKIARTLTYLSMQYKNTYGRSVARIGTLLYFLGLTYLGIAALLLFAYTTIPVLEGMGNGF